jgi:nitrite reductase/ring-hydroxylating ferredoxin subunit
MRPEVRWSAQDYMPADDIPYIGRASGGTDRIFVATGFKKWGLSSGALASLLIRDLIEERDNPWLEVFDATRVDPARAGKTLLKENVNVAKRFVGDRVADALSGTIEDLAPGQGDVVHVGGDPAAVFRDEGGDVHVLSPVCTHLGCHVRFNAAERSWDCPCHGSRFAVDGSVLEGPATEPLARLDVPEGA